MSSPVLLELKKIRKSFHGVHALRGIDFVLEKGMGLALVGENGAGKSTLMKILGGVYPYGEYEGQIYLAGGEVQFRRTKDAEQLGINIIHQELNLFAELTVAENIFLGHYPLTKWGCINTQLMVKKSQEILNKLEVSFGPNALVGDLTPGEQQMVEIGKAFARQGRILILDEPSSSLTQKETVTLINLIRKLQREDELSFIYISHKLEEVYALCSHVCVLRDGESIFQGELGHLPTSALIEHMVGRTLSHLYPPLCVASSEQLLSPCFEMKNWSAYKKTQRKWRVKNLSFKAYAGEILGIAGMMGSGRSDILLSFFGHDKYKTSGEACFDSNPSNTSITSITSNNTPALSLRHKIGLVTEDRKKSGLHQQHAIFENIILPLLSSEQAPRLIQREQLLAVVNSLTQKLMIKISDLNLPVNSMSGGNQQKVAIAKWLAVGPKMLFLDEPTRGVDVGAKWEIYTLLTELTKAGVLIIIVSSELPELIGLCQRILVIREGELMGELVGEERTPQRIMALGLGQ